MPRKGLKMLKALIEKRNAKAERMNAIVSLATTETRALTEEENSEFAALEAEVRDLDETIAKAKNEVEMMVAEVNENEKREDSAEVEVETREINEFANYIRGEVTGEVRSDTNLTKGDNGAVIPTTIANMIVKEVVDICPIYAAATKFNVKGQLDIPYYDETSGSITVGWHDEFTDLESTSAKFSSISLTGYLAGALTKISKSLLNNTNHSLVAFIVSDIAEKVAIFIEDKLLNGDEKVDGMKKCKLTVKTAAATPTADELITIQDTIKDRFQGSAMWIMSSKTRTAIRQLKDNENRYMLNPDMTTAFGYTLLGKPVYVTDAIKDDSIFYGDFSALAVKEVESPEISILREHYHIQHAIGIDVWFEFDAKVYDAQRIVKAGSTVETIAAKGAEPVAKASK